MKRPTESKVIEFIEHMRAVGYTYQSVEFYRIVLNRAKRDFGEGWWFIDREKLEAGLIEKYKAGMSRYVLNIRISVMRTFCEWLRGSKIIQNNPIDGIKTKNLIERNT